MKITDTQEENAPENSRKGISESADKYGLGTDEEKSVYVQEFHENINDLIVKKILSRKAYRTRYLSRSEKPKYKFGQRTVYTLRNGKATIEFYVESRPWNLTEGSIYLEAGLADSNNLLIPKRKIPKSEGAVWRPQHFSNIFYFLSKTKIISMYLNIVELTRLDVSMFDSIESLVKDIFDAR